jgi:hypothetical protein
MADQWKASVRTIGGVAAALIDVSITRTIPVDVRVLEEISGLMRDAGLSEAADFVRAIQKLPPEMRRYTAIPWSDADSHQINLLPFSQIISRFDTKLFWRVEGSAATGFTGILNLSGIDRKIDMSQAALPEFLAKVDATQAEAQKDLDEGKMKRETWDKVRDLCDRMRTSRDECSALYDVLLKERRETERQRRDKMERDRADRERQQQERGSYHGDFPGGWGDRFTGTA